MGVAQAVADASHPLRFTGIRDDAQRSLLAPRIPSAARGIHRQALHTALFDTASQLAELHMGARVTSIDVGSLTDDLASVAWMSVSGHYTMRADLIIGADGARSELCSGVRQGASPRHSGYSAWRGVVADRDIVNSDWAIGWGSQLEFSAVRISTDAVAWHALYPTPSLSADPGDPEQILTRLAAWPDPAAQLAATTVPRTLLRHDLTHLNTTPTSFSSGRAVLLGDAAHPVLPTANQGANLALEDATTLGRLLLPRGDLQPALDAYDAHRIPRARTVHRVAHRLAALGAGCSDGLERSTRDRALRGRPGRFLERSLRQLPAWSGAPALTDRVPWRGLLRR